MLSPGRALSTGRASMRIHYPKTRSIFSRLYWFDAQPDEVIALRFEFSVGVRNNLSVMKLIYRSTKIVDTGKVEDFLGHDWDSRWSEVCARHEQAQFV